MLQQLDSYQMDRCCRRAAHTQPYSIALDMRSRSETEEGYEPERQHYGLPVFLKLCGVMTNFVSQEVLPHETTSA